MESAGGFNIRIEQKLPSLQKDLQSLKDIFNQHDFKLFLKNNPTILHKTDKYGYSLLWYAAIGNPNINSVKFLLHEGAVVDMPIEAGSTVFMSAVFNGNIEIAEVLRKAGANINHQNKNGHCALTMAVRSGKKESIEYLLKLPGIELALKDKFGKYPIEYFNIETTNTHRNVLAHALYKKKLYDPLNRYIHVVGASFIKETDPELYEIILKLQHGTKRQPSIFGLE